MEPQNRMTKLDHVVNTEANQWNQEQEKPVSRVPICRPDSDQDDERDT
jgi:CBS domain containing-hemolysin-like protein